MLWNYLEKILLKVVENLEEKDRKIKISKVVADKGVICGIYTITLRKVLLLELCQKGMKKRNLLGIVFK
jgi:hypothetical protein